MATQSLYEDGRMSKTAVVLRLLSLPVFFLLFPALVLFGGSTDLINWGPGLLFAGLACLFLLDKDRHAMRAGMLHTVCYALLLVLLMIRAQYSADRSAAVGDTALLTLAVTGYLIGKLAGIEKMRALLVGLSLVALLGLFCTIMQMSNPVWNLVYPHRSGNFPSGFFAHYNYATAFGLGAGGLLISAACRERHWLKFIFIAGAAGALVAIPLSLSRGGNLAFAIVVASTGALLLARAFSSSKSFVNTWLPALALVSLALIFASSVVPLIGREHGADGFYTDGVRISFWEAAAEMTMSQAWLGGGPGSFTWGVYHVLTGLGAEPVMAHNEAMQLAVDYGYPALLLMALLIAVPVIQSFWRFINRRDPQFASLGALGLVAMLIQSNFDFVFHTGPGAFVAALIIGHLARSLWNPASAVSAGADEHARFERDYRLAVLAHVKDFSAGKTNAVSDLIATLSRSDEEQWQRSSYRVSYWSKVKNEAALQKAIADLGIKCKEELALMALVEGEESSSSGNGASSWGWSLLSGGVLAGCGVPIAYAGLLLTLALSQAWNPLYHPNRLTVSGRFEALLGLVERHPGLGIDREVLTAARERIHQLGSIEAREDWAEAHRQRIIRAVPSWQVDPRAALLLAEIVGWSGDFESALSYYDQAIEAQGRNEALFMAHAFKGQYLYEIFLSTRAGGQIEEQKIFAQRAIESFQNADAAMKNTRSLPRNFALMLQECESFDKGQM
jgi:tetratricopeptide (TPR) repeat protein